MCGGQTDGCDVMHPVCAAPSLPRLARLSRDGAVNIINENLWVKTIQIPDVRPSVTDMIEPRKINSLLMGPRRAATRQCSDLNNAALSNMHCVPQLFLTPARGTPSILDKLAPCGHAHAQSQFLQ